MLTTNIELAKNALINNQLVAIPTETVYGLAANAYNEVAIKKIFELKKRPYNNPLIVHLKSIDAIKDIAIDIPDAAFKLAETFWPGSLTLVLKKKSNISNLITAGNDTVAVRVPNHPLCIDLLKNLDFPLVAPSANPFGSISPTNANHVLEYFGDSLKIILDGGVCQNGLESTIIGFENNQPILYRYGAIVYEDIEKVLGKLFFYTNEEKTPIVPGMFSRHYAPATDLYLTNNVSKLLATFQGKKIGVLMFKNRLNNTNINSQEILSENGDLKIAGENLYAALHRLDKRKLDVILAEILPNIGLGKTINDKLERASKK